MKGAPTLELGLHLVLPCVFLTHQTFCINLFSLLLSWVPCTAFTSALSMFSISFLFTSESVCVQLPFSPIATLFFPLGVSCLPEERLDS